jgi:hypothetical protein
MWGWLERVMPHAGVEADNPLFKYEVRRLSWATSPGQLNNFGIRLFFCVLIIIGSL